MPENQSKSGQKPAEKQPKSGKKEQIQTTV
jgi:hypothetical protein